MVLVLFRLERLGGVRESLHILKPPGLCQLERRNSHLIFAAIWCLGVEKVCIWVGLRTQEVESLQHLLLPWAGFVSAFGLCVL